MTLNAGSIPMRRFSFRALNFVVAPRWSIVLLLTLLFVAPFMVPIHRPPQAAFDVEWISGVVLALLAITVGAAASTPMRLQWPLPAWLGTAVLVASVQYALGMMSYSAQLSLLALYGFAIVAAYCVGRVLVAGDMAALAGRVIAISLVAAGIASVGIQWMQVLQVKGLPTWLYFDAMDPWLRSRPFANLGQVNLLAAYLGWALFAVLYVRRVAFGPRAALVLVACLAMGIGLTSSRMGALFALSFAGGLWFPSALRPARVAERVGLSMALLLGFALGVAAVKILVTGGGAESVIERFAGETYLVRIVMWLDAWHVSQSAPLLGVGFGQYGVAQYWAANADPHLLGTPYVHNIVLQIAAELGWPVALAMIVLGAWWLLGSVRARLQKPESAFAIGVLVIVTIHSLLEWPLWHLNVAIPTALLFALAEPTMRSSAGVSARLLVAAGVAGIITAIPMMLEFNELSDLTARIDSERVTQKEYSDETLMRVVSVVNASSLLKPFAERIYESLRDPLAPASAEDIAMHERVLSRVAEPRAISRLIIALARSGRVDESVRHVARLRVFAAGDYDSFRALIIDAIKDLGDNADRLRQALDMSQSARAPDSP